MFFANTKALTLEDDDDFINNLVEDFNESINIMFFLRRWQMDHFTSLSVVLQFQFVDEQGGWWLGHMVFQLSHDVVWQLEVGETFLSDQGDCFAIDW
jgi:hypothetical protein